MRFQQIAVACALLDARAFATQPADNQIQLGPRPYYLVSKMDAGSPLKQQLETCSVKDFKTNDFIISHRGAPLQFPEHTAEGVRAAARQGAGVIECDVTFTKDKQLVCRHSQCDLHTTTNILLTPLAAKCTQPFVPANGATPASAKCCTSDITLAEFRSLCAKMDAAYKTATTAAAYVGEGTPFYRTDLYATCGTLMSHADYIGLVSSLGKKFTPEAKLPEVPMPYQGTYTQEQFVQQIVNEYKAANIPPSSVWLQSFERGDMLYLVANEPEFAKQAVYLDQNVDNGIATLGNGDLNKYFNDIVADGINIVAPAMYALITIGSSGTVVPSAYATAARAAGLDIITWSFERSPPMQKGGAADYYYASVTPYMTNDGRTLEVLDVLARQVGVISIFSDWPATVTYYWNCVLCSANSNGSGHRRLRGGR
ncbi:glycerophosphoryl diester phosphodiesterase family protein [Tribonema minus]|uniref:glycerophosphodiester phosphodiesterase n=1 Tax=Tribonema minus TaxID=303371 RepID=A0A836CAA8_9STRA|nr:glycerophosphoryl diester phosphodiesterase family protein [Tribonema minus]